MQEDCLVSYLMTFFCLLLLMEMKFQHSSKVGWMEIDPIKPNVF